MHWPTKFQNRNSWCQMFLSGIAILWGACDCHACHIISYKLAVSQIETDVGHSYLFGNGCSSCEASQGGMEDLSKCELWHD